MDFCKVDVVQLLNSAGADLSHQLRMVVETHVGALRGRRTAVLHRLHVLQMVGRLHLLQELGLVPLPEAAAAARWVRGLLRASGEVLLQGCKHGRAAKCMYASCPGEPHRGKWR